MGGGSSGGLKREREMENNIKKRGISAKGRERKRESAGRRGREGEKRV
jgi:hypothetical protein